MSSFSVSLNLRLFMMRIIVFVFRKESPPLPTSIPCHRSIQGAPTYSYRKKSSIDHGDIEHRTLSVRKIRMCCALSADQKRVEASCFEYGDEFAEESAGKPLLSKEAVSRMPCFFEGE